MHIYLFWYIWHDNPVWEGEFVRAKPHQWCIDTFAHQCIGPAAECGLIANILYSTCCINRYAVTVDRYQNQLNCHDLSSSPVFAQISKYY